MESPLPFGGGDFFALSIPIAKNAFTKQGEPPGGTAFKTVN